MFTGAKEYGVYLFQVWQQRDQSYPQKDDELFQVERGLAVKGNVLVDVSVRGLRLSGDDADLLGAILDKI
jgi:hypothetical protein